VEKKYYWAIYYLLVIKMKGNLLNSAFFFFIFLSPGPDSESGSGSGSTKLLTADPMRIRIHNSEKMGP
jgi:hypothetical protein